MKNTLLIITLLIQTFGFGQNDSIWSFNEYWGLLPDGVGLSAGGAIDRQNDGVLDILYTTDIGVNEDIIIYPMGILINDGSGGLSLGSDSLLINAESTQSGKIYVFDFNNDGLDDAYIDDTGNDIEPFPLPLAFRLGIENELMGTNSEFYKSDVHSLTVAFDGVVPNDYTPTGHLGLEYGYNNLGFIRGGVRLGHDTATISGGGGIRLKTRALAIIIDYAFVDFGILKLSHQVGLGLEF